MRLGCNLAMIRNINISFFSGIFLTLKNSSFDLSATQLVSVSWRPLNMAIYFRLKEKSSKLQSYLSSKKSILLRLSANISAASPNFFRKYCPNLSWLSLNLWKRTQIKYFLVTCYRVAAWPFENVNHRPLSQRNSCLETFLSNNCLGQDFFLNNEKFLNISRHLSGKTCVNLLNGTKTDIRSSDTQERYW